MIIKIPVYFEIVAEGNAKITDHDILKKKVSQEVYENLERNLSNITLEGNLFWNNERLSAYLRDSSEVLEYLRTKK